MQEIAEDFTVSVADRLGADIPHPGQGGVGSLNLDASLQQAAGAPHDRSQPD